MLYILRATYIRGEKLEEVIHWEEMIDDMSINTEFKDWLFKPHDFPIGSRNENESYSVSTRMYHFTGYAGVLMVRTRIVTSLPMPDKQIRKYFITPKGLLKYLERQGMLWDFLDHVPDNQPTE